MSIVTLDQLEELTKSAPAVAINGRSDRGRRTLDLVEWFTENNVPVEGPSPWEGGQKWVFQVCPWNAEHTNRSAFVVQLASGAISAGCHHNGCEGKGWTDLCRLYEPAATKHDESSEDAEWGSPIPFTRFLSPPFPVHVLPAWLRAFVESVSEATQTPVDLAAMLSLSVLAAATAGRLIVRVRPGYREPLNIFTVTAMPPANRKSAVFRALLQPLEHLERDESARVGDEIAKATSRQRIQESRLKQLQNKAAQAKDHERELLIQESEDLAVSTARERVPSPPRLIVDDCTPEQLARLLQEQGGRLAVMSPEGDVFEILAGRYSQGVSNFGVYLHGHAGDTIRVDRVGRPPEYISNPALTVGLTVQPDVIRGLCAKPGFRGRGLLGRFLYSMPTSMLGRRRVDVPPVSPEVTMAYEENILRLAKIRPITYEDEETRPYELIFDADAHSEFLRLQEWVEPQLAETGELGYMSDWAGKLCGAAARICGLLHLAKFADEAEPWQQPVGRQTVCDAGEIAHYLIAHAQQAFAEMGADEVQDGALKIFHWIKEKNVQQFTKRDLFQGLKGTFKRVEFMNDPLKTLIDFGYLRGVDATPTGTAGRRPSPIYLVNPLWRRGADRGAR